jgi:hypothetical protein
VGERKGRPGDAGAAAISQNSIERVCRPTPFTLRCQNNAPDGSSRIVRNAARQSALPPGEADHGEQLRSLVQGFKGSALFGIAATAPIIAIYTELVASLVVERKKHLRLVANVPEGAAVDLALVKLPKGALTHPNPPAPGEAFSLTSLRNPRNTTKEFVRKATALGRLDRRRDRRLD